jgi:hypothetical protein
MVERSSIAGAERAWASPAALRERCPVCQETAMLFPSHGRDGGRRMCLGCGQRERRGEPPVIPERPTLFDGSDIDTEAGR